MAMHPDGDIVATGQMAGKELKGPPSNTRGGGQKKALAQGKLVDIYVWSASTREVLATTLTTLLPWEFAKFSENTGSTIFEIIPPM